ncbi:hypothetical protein HC028_21100 [Planosporangium flavigriseum]|nr:hypothetical protein [Planosporangium flavigriseum]NJC66982.1 hypothetical protein [Planosporangium flavigriseum]
MVAGRLDSPPDAWSGVWIAEDIELIAQGVRNGNWIDSSLGVVGAGLDALAMVSDPVGVLLQYGVAWIIEHVKPLSEALDWLAGDPGQIAGHAQTWRNVAASLHEQAADLDRAVRWDVTDWGGTAGQAYRTWSKQQHDAVVGLAKGAETMAAITEGAGALIAAVRILVRDAIATCVSRLITYAAEEAFSLGLATPLVVEQVSTLVASWAAKIARWLKGLLASLRRLIPDAHRLSELIDALKRLLRKLLPGGKQGSGGTTPSRKPGPNAKPRGPRTDAHPTRKLDRPKRRENEAADTLAEHGYDVEQNPPRNPNGKDPDYKIEGEYFDCYAPQTKNLDNIRDEVSGKVKEGQADRIVLNLDDCPRSAEEIAGILERKPVTGLKEILVVEDGQVSRLYPPTS